MNVYRKWRISVALMLLAALPLPFTTASADAPPADSHASLPDPPIAPGNLPDTVVPLPPAEQKGIDAQHRIDAAIEKLGYLIETGHAQDAVPDLVKLKSMPTERGDPLVQALIAQVALAEKKPEAAWQIIKPWSEHAKLVHPELARPWLAVGDVYMAQEQYDKALKHFDWLTAGLSKIDPKTADISPAQWAEELALSAEGCGMACFYLDRDNDARDSLTFALKIASTRLPHPKDHDKWLIDRIRAELAMATPSEDVKKYGEDYVLFRNAERDRRAAHQPTKAIDLYTKLIRKFPKSVFCEPSELASALCLLDEGKKDEGEQSLQQFAAAKPNGLYTGEALLELARSSLVDQLNPQQAILYFDKLDHWLTAARRGKNVPAATEPSNGARSVSKGSPDAAPGTNNSNPPTDELRPATKAITTPPQKMKRTDYFGNVTRNPVAIGDLMNQLTCPWYLDDLEVQASQLKGFVLFVQGKKKEALALAKRVLELDPEAAHEEAAGDWNDYRRFKWALDHGYFYAYPPELALYNDRQRFVVLLGDFYYCSTQFEKGAALFRRILKGEFGTLTPLQEEYPHFALGSCLYRLRFRQGDYSNREFLAEMEKILVHNSGSFTDQRAMVAYANIGSQTQDKKVKAKAYKYLLAMANLPQNNEWTYIARINLANRRVAEGKRKEAIEIFQRFSKADGAFYDLAQFFLNQTLASLTQEKEGNHP